MKNRLIGMIMILGLSQSIQASSSDDPLMTMLVMDRFEILNNSDNTGVWEGSFYMGYDLDKLYLYSAGDATSNGIESSQNELVYARAIAPFWDAQIGLAYDEQNNNSQTWAEIAISGLAPYYFETRSALLINSDGNIGLRLDAEYEMLFTQKLILSSSIEADFYTQDDSTMQLGSGLSSMEAGFRLRYEWVREFAPYVGVTWEKTFGNTYDYNPIDETNIVFGARFWF